MSEAADMAKEFINVPQDQATPTNSFIGSAIALILMYIVMGFVSGRYNAQASRGLISKLRLPIFGFFLIIVLGFQFGVNYAASAVKCGSPQLGQSLWFTLFPNLIYTGSVILLLHLFPGFKSVFSNTIGYFIIGIPLFHGGIKKVFRKLMLPPSNNELVKKVYTDESELVNLMTPKITDFWARMKDFEKLFYNGAVVFKPDPKAKKFPRSMIDMDNSLAKKYIKKLYALITIKDYVGEFMWLFLTTLVVSATSFNFVLGIDNCKLDAQMIKAKKEIMKKANEGTKEVKTEVKETVRQIT
tara:strand:+ start:526 stop:1422 length:897 start_codon:yes stop_codon:yes gene_type:complete